MFKLLYKTIILWFCLSLGLYAGNVKVLATGGTIAGTADSNTKTVGYKAATLGADSLIDAIPEIKKLVNVSTEQVVQIGSQDMNGEIWLNLAKRVQAVVNDSKIDGVVITHGTDTLEETAYFLNLVIKTQKPIILVGAMRPATSMSADGNLNLYNAILVANSKEAINKGVLVVMNDGIYSARDITKTNTSLVNAFKSLDVGLLGTIQNGNIEFYHNPVRLHTNNSEFNINDIKALPRVDIFYAYSNAPIEYFETAKRLKVVGIVYAGMGNGSMSKQVENVLRDLAKNNIVIVRSSRVNSGIIAHNGEVNDDDANFISSSNLNPQKARILLMLSLTKTKDVKQIQKIFDSY